MILYKGKAKDMKAYFRTLLETYGNITIKELEEIFKCKKATSSNF